MSRLWPDRLLVSLAPDAVALARVAAGPRPRLLDKHALDCDAAFGVEAWQGAVAAFGTAMQALPGARLRVTVVLSNEFVRYAVVPFDGAVTSPEEDVALARFHFGKVYGERARTWDVRVAPAPRGAPRLASAVDPALIEAVRTLFPKRGPARLASVQPYLMSAFNLWGRGMGQDSWLLLVEPRRACCARLDARGRWATVRTVRGGFPAAGDWAALIEREGLRSGAETANTVLVHAPALGTPAREAAPARRFVGLTLPVLDGYLPLEDGCLAMALTAR